MNLCRDSDVRELFEICWFSEIEAVDIEKIFLEKGIAFTEQVFQYYRSRYIGCRERYKFYVPKEQYLEAIALLKEYFDLAEPQKFSGYCPACGCHAQNTFRCAGCGLNLSGTALPAISNHPFVRYLKDLELL